MDEPKEDLATCTMEQHEEMMKTDTAGFKKHLEEAHGGNDPHQHDMR